MIPPTDTKQDASAGQIVRRRIVLRQPQRVPHGNDVEATPKLDPPRQVRQMNRQHQDVRYDLISFALEMVLREPENVVAFAIHKRGDGGSLVEDGHQLLVRQPALVHGRGVQAMPIEVHVAGVQATEASNHGDLRRCRRYHGPPQSGLAIGPSDGVVPLRIPQDDTMSSIDWECRDSTGLQLRHNIRDSAHLAQTPKAVEELVRVPIAF